MVRLYVTGKVSSEDLIWIRELVAKEVVALDKWSTIVDHLVPQHLAEDLLRIEQLIRIRMDYNQAVSLSLRLWHRHGEGEISHLLKVFHDKGLNVLAGKVQTEFQARRDSIGSQQQVFSNRKCWKNRKLILACIVLLISILIVCAHHLVPMEDEKELEPRTPVLVLPHKWWPVEKELIAANAFVNRTADDGQPITVHLRRQLLDSSAATGIVARKQAIVGMGGIGKTSVAKWYAIEYQNEYDHIIWINSEGSSLKESFIELGEDLGLTDANLNEKKYDRYDSIAQYVYRRLITARCLFVFDNAKDFDSLQAVLSRIELHHTIITSRNQHWGNSNEFQIPTIRLDVFNNTECMLLLSNTVRGSKRGTEDEMFSLCKKLGFLPLAVQVAVAAITKSSWYTLSTYLQRSKEDMKDLIDQRQLTEYQQSITATLEISIDVIQKETNCGDLCMTVLYVAAYSSPDKIFEEWLLVASSNESEVKNAIDILMQFSILSVDRLFQPIVHNKRQFGLHRLLQLVLKMRAAGDSIRAIKAVKLALDNMHSNFENRGTWPDFDQGFYVWTGATEEFDEILQTYHEFPLYFQLLPEWYFKSLVNWISQVFSETDLQIVQFKLRTLCPDWKKPTGHAQRNLDSLNRELSSQTWANVPYLEQLRLHLGAVELYLKCKNLSEREITDENNLEMSYMSLIQDMDKIGYDGQIGGTVLYFPSQECKFTRGSLKVALTLGYVVNCAANKTEAVTVLSKLIESTTDLMTIASINAVWEGIQSRPELVVGMVPTLHKVLQRIMDMKAVKLSQMYDVLKLYAYWFSNGQREIAPYLDPFMFCTHLQWSCNQDLLRITIIEGFSLFEFIPDKNLRYFEPALNFMWNKCTEIYKNSYVNNGAFAELLLKLNEVYSRVLLHSGRKLEIVAVDKITIGLLTDSMPWKELWWDMEFSNPFSEIVAVDGVLGEISKSKLRLLLHVIGNLGNREKQLIRPTVDRLSIVTGILDSASLNLVLNYRYDEAIAAWKYLLLVLEETKTHVNLEFIASLGIETRVGLRWRKKPVNLWQLIALLAEFVKGEIEQDTLHLNYNFGRQGQNAVAEFIANLMEFHRLSLALDLCALLAQNQTNELGKTLSVIWKPGHMTHEYIDKLFITLWEFAFDE